MNINRLAFNVIGLVIAGVLFLAFFGTLFVVLPGKAPKYYGWWLSLAALEAFAAVTVSAGGIINLARGRRLDPWPTGIMIVGYIATIWLLPLALWGVVSLIIERRHRQQKLKDS